MTDDLLEQLKAMDQAVLTDVVRKDQHNSDLVILDWAVEPISHQKIVDSTGGLFCFSGRSQSTQGIQPWKVVVKCINNSKGLSEQPRTWYYWRREIIAFQSGFLEQLPSGVRAPRFYGVMENENGAWIWIEHIKESTSKQWSLNDFQRTARQLGRFQGAYLSGTPLVDQSWLSQSFFRNVWNEQDWWSGFMNPTSEENAWQSPVTQRGFDDRKKSRTLQLLGDKVLFLDVNDRLPQVLCHHDTSRRNFMWSRAPKTGDDELICIDWAYTGIGALGNDLGQLFETSLFLFEYSLTDMETLEAALLEGYLTGLEDNGVTVDVRLVRLGYLISLSLWMGVMLPAWAALILSPDSGFNVEAMYGHTAEEVLAGWVQLHEFCVDRADEARTLIKQLGL